MKSDGVLNLCLWCLALCALAAPPLAQCRDFALSSMLWHHQRISLDDQTLITTIRPSASSSLAFSSARSLASEYGLTAEAPGDYDTLETLEVHWENEGDSRLLKLSVCGQSEVKVHHDEQVVVNQKRAGDCLNYFWSSDQGQFVITAKGYRPVRAGVQWNNRHYWLGSDDLQSELGTEPYAHGDYHLTIKHTTWKEELPDIPAASPGLKREFQASGNAFIDSGQPPSKRGGGGPADKVVSIEIWSWWEQLQTVHLKRNLLTSIAIPQMAVRVYTTDGCSFELPMSQAALLMALNSEFAVDPWLWTHLASGGIQSYQLLAIYLDSLVRLTSVWSSELPLHLLPQIPVEQASSVILPIQCMFSTRHGNSVQRDPVTGEVITSSNQAGGAAGNVGGNPGAVGGSGNGGRPPNGGGVDRSATETVQNELTEEEKLRRIIVALEARFYDDGNFSLMIRHLRAEGLIDESYDSMEESTNSVRVHTLFRHLEATSRTSPSTYTRFLRALKASAAENARHSALVSEIERQKTFYSGGVIRTGSARNIDSTGQVTSISDFLASLRMMAPVPAVHEQVRGETPVPPLQPVGSNLERHAINILRTRLIEQMDFYSLIPQLLGEQVITLNQLGGLLSEMSHQTQQSQNAEVLRITERTPRPSTLLCRVLSRTRSSEHHGELLRELQRIAPCNTEAERTLPEASLRDIRPLAPLLAAHLNVELVVRHLQLNRAITEHDAREIIRDSSTNPGRARLLLLERLKRHPNGNRLLLQAILHHAQEAGHSIIIASLGNYLQLLDR